MKLGLCLELFGGRLSFSIRSTPDGKTWTEVARDTVYMPAYKKAQQLSQGSRLYYQVWRDYSGEGKEDVPMACFARGQIHSWERDGFPG